MCKDDFLWHNSFKFYLYIILLFYSHFGKIKTGLLAWGYFRMIFQKVKFIAQVTCGLGVGISLKFGKISKLFSSKKLNSIHIPRKIYDKIRQGRSQSITWVLLEVLTFILTMNFCNRLWTIFAIKIVRLLFWNKTSTNVFFCWQNSFKFKYKSPTKLI